MRQVLRNLLLLLAISSFAFASDASTNFTGHYEFADTQADHVFAIDVQQTGDQATISFSASMNDGSGAAPEADGKGQIKGQALTFAFKDSFDNEGTGSLELTKGGYHLKLDATKVADPRCLRFYGDLALKKTSDKPQ